jgi:ABC-2 type transport system ATP-binding protein
MAIVTKSLTRKFGDFVAVDSLDLDVPEGSIYGFLGPNGAGKSTTINCLTGLLNPTSGTIRILGMDPSVDPIAIKKKVGVVPESLALFDRLTGFETLQFVGRVHGLDTDTLRTRSSELLEFMSLTEAADGIVGDYSHGMRKKIALASALLPAPRLLFLDEPFEGIDAIASRQIKDLLIQFASNGGTIFLTSHILEIVDRLANHLGVIQKGKLVAQGSMEELRAGAGSGKGLEEIFLNLVGADGESSVTLDWLGG